MNAIKSIYGQQEHSSRRGLSWVVLFFILLLITPTASAQITIGGNVYGGGNEGEVKGNTNVTVKAGNIGARGTTSTTPLTMPQGKVFGGARMANVGGSTFVHIDGKEATGDIVINHVYGGNDIAGIVGGNNSDEKVKRTAVPTALTKAGEDGVTTDWNSFVLVSTKLAKFTQEEITAAQAGDPAYGKTTADDNPAKADPTNKKIYIGQLFAGGNGDYRYDNPLDNGDGTVTYNVADPKTGTSLASKTVASGESGFVMPDLAKSYLDVHGGSIVYAYGGGNNVTVKEDAVIRIENPSSVVNSIVGYDAVPEVTSTELLTTARFKEMGINMGFSHPSSGEYQIGSFFGGNNKADMAIRPSWHLVDGKVRTLYSGGNRGRMIYKNGLFLEIPEASTLEVGDLYGGCRMADVRPMIWDPGLVVEGQEEPGGYTDVDEVDNDIPGYSIPRNLAARVVVLGGNVHNVYGGNDIRGKVYFGNAIGIRTSISGNVYGGGNGAYPYTDNPSLQDDDVYGDLYYDPKKYGKSAVESLLDIRPDAEQVSIHIRGKDASHPTIIGGSVFVGGNCATLEPEASHANLENYPLTELKIGSWTIADQVYLGNNGEGMVTTNEREEDGSGNLIRQEGVLRTYQRTDLVSEGKFNSMDLTNLGQMSTYMSAVQLNQLPRLCVDVAGVDREGYDPYTSFIGSLFFGGNRGSMAYGGSLRIDPSAPVYIYNKLVAGCNNANIPRSQFNARYEGGILGSTSEQVDDLGESHYVNADGRYKDRVLMTLSQIKLVPMRQNKSKTGWDCLEWNTYNKNASTGKYEPETLTYTTSAAVTSSGVSMPIVNLATGTASATDKSRRLVGANVYGGCYQSGHVNGNIVINLKGTLHNRKDIFDAFTGEEEGDNILYDYTSYSITGRHSGVILNEQGMDVLGEAMTVYGGGKGKETEVWGRTSVNIQGGYTFQVFGGSDEGAVGKSTSWQEDATPDANGAYTGKYVYPNKTTDDLMNKYSTCVTINCDKEGVSRAEDSTDAMADVEFIYGGGFSGLILGNTRTNLGNGRVFNLFAGSCNADVLGHTETYVGQWTADDGVTTVTGFPYLRDHIYGGNDLGGKIKGVATFTSRVKEGTLPLVHAKDVDDGTGTATGGDYHKDVLQASSYVEYRQGYMKNIFGGCFGDYDYETDFRAYPHPELNNAFVNFRPNEKSRNHVEKVFGGGQGHLGDRDGDMVQNRSYVLIDIADDQENFANTEVFGSGMNNGLGTKYGSSDIVESGFNGDKASAIIDLAHGKINAAYGGSYNEGVTGRTVVRVPQGSTINVHNVFGGAYGTDALPPCDVYASNVEYSSADAVLRSVEKDGVTEAGGIYGGNNNVRRTLYTKVDINSPVYTNKEKTSLGTVYGAGYGATTWSEYTLVNLNDGARVSQVYGGGQLGQVLNAESIRAYMNMFNTENVSSVADLPSHIKASFVDKYGSNTTAWGPAWRAAWTLGKYYVPQTDADFNQYTELPLTNLTNPLLTREAEMDDRDLSGLTAEQKKKIEKKYNTNVIIHKGATVEGYAYGGGLGDASVANSGDVLGTTYIALLGGTVTKDLSAAGTTGNVYNLYTADNVFTASANAYIQGGTVRNVFGGGWRGSVGYHNGHINNVTANSSDKDGETHVVIGTLSGTAYDNGVPSITRNVYGGGEGGCVYGTANVKMNNGYIGYRYKNTAAEGETAKYNYVPELDDKAPGDNLLEQGGNIFGGGYVANSYVDKTDLNMYGGTVRGSLHGGGEIGPVGRGSVAANAANTGIENNNAKIYKAGKTKVTLYDGWVKKNVFGGGRGYDNWDGEGWMSDEEKLTMDLSSKGYVFGQTEVNIHGGEIGTEEEMLNREIEASSKSGNVFGGGDVGFVYSAYQNDSGVLSMGKPSGMRYDDGDEGYYYKYENGGYVTTGTEKILTEDCKVLVEPWCKAIQEITLNSKTFKAGDYVPTDYLNYLGNKNDANWDKISKKDVNKNGILIHNAIFAGGNTSSNSTTVYANTTTVYGNTTASVHDVYHRDLITVGTGHTGGIYGEGNLTLVDGYRELNITNYGTDYYSISPEITYEQYEALPDREAAYYEIRYRCAIACTDKDGKHYAKGSNISADELQTVFEGVSVDKYDVEYEGEGENRKVKLDSEGYPISTKGEGQYSMLLADGVTPQPAYWIQNGVCSRYAGRIMNTVQRADFCGVYGSRMVMQGAQDRVPATVDYTNYTINRVREVSLNKQSSVRSADNLEPTDDDYWRITKHGNYFGIYNIVHFLGALTSDFDFGDGGSTTVAGDIRTTDNQDGDTYKCPAGEGEGAKAYGVATYYDWKKAFHDERKRNNGNSHNKVALASGVYLELTTEKGEGKGDGLYDKDWGYITGVVELDLINVQPGMGGGFVYAKNVHGVRKLTNLTQTTLASLNAGAVTRKKYRYETAAAENEWQSSGNFVHSTQTIIDDCYNVGGRYLGDVKTDGTGAMPAHYWYIRGSVYVYDQYISAYTGSPNAYSEVVNIPLTITSASNGKMTLMDVKPNYYAYYSVNTGSSTKKLGTTDEIVLRDVTYKLNDPINYWDYKLLSDAEKRLFVAKTYVTTDSCKIGNTYYPKGYVMLPDDYDTLKESSKQATEDDGYIYPVQIATIDSDGNPTVKKDANNADVYEDFDDVFHESNNLSHTTGYILTYNVNNPKQWDAWYTPKSGTSLTGKIKKETYGEKTEGEKATYENGPTYTPTTAGIYGQQDYVEGNIISHDIYDPYSKLTDAQKSGLTNQAEFESAYIVTTDVLEATNKNGTSQRFYKDAMLAKSDYVITNGESTDASLWNAISGSVAEAYVVTNTIQLSETDYIYRNTYMTLTQKNDLKTANPSLAAEIEKNIVPAYYCTSGGKYGGDYYESNKNYRATEAFSGMSDSDRSNFTFNYDALDLLIDPTYGRAEGVKYQYDGNYTEASQVRAEGTGNPAEYSLQTAIDYTATYKGTSLTYTYNGASKTINTNDVIGREEYESLPNERHHYSPITVSEAGKYYVAMETIVLGDTPYAAGQVVDKKTYDGLNDIEKEKVKELTFSTTGTYYYCREGYTIDTDLYTGDKTGAVTSVNGVGNGTTYTSSVPTGIVITESNYTDLVNKQTNFVIHGLAPTETSTLYVARNSDINDLSTEKIITVIYQYDYEESDKDGLHITPVSERHVLNIHISFKSGVPTVEDIQAPSIVLPGTTVSINEPFVKPGAYEVTGSGWELFDDKNDAESHTNGIPYTPNDDPLYLYQNNYLVAYYTKTYLGKTYSNAVPVSVANYHDLKKVMDDTGHHYYIDHKDVIDKDIDPKIYINDYTTDNPATSQNALDLFKNLYDLSLLTSTSDGVSDGKATIGGKSHALLDKTRVGAGKNLEFFLRTDIDHSGSSWTSIAGTDCFAGTLHGDGHHLKGLTSSLFDHLCGDVYNLGVSGTFTGAGIAESGDGYVENCWVSTTSDKAKTTQPVFGNPTRAANDPKGPIQIVNCYYQEEDNAGETLASDNGENETNTIAYTNHAANSIHGIPTRKTKQAFNNGEVAYDLNGFYLYKRYSDKLTSSGESYSYWKPVEDEPQTGHYSNVDAALCSSGSGGMKYVEDRFANGDFVYANGTIPEQEDERFYSYVVTDAQGQVTVVREYYPIWPDDYLFFGQTLTYGHVDGRPHQGLPTSIKRGKDSHLLTDVGSNRVYRAPAYFRNSEMSVAHFNPAAMFAKTQKDDASVFAYKDMTAIDFTGYNDVTYPYDKGWKQWSKTSQAEDGKSTEAYAFYPPLLDDGGLISFTNIDLTKNLLVYTDATHDHGHGTTAAANTSTAVSNFLEIREPDYLESSEGYRNILKQTSTDVLGHWVENGVALTNHFLVDKEDFNAPIDYHFVSGDDGTRMWYQRMPDHYVDIEWVDDDDNPLTPDIRTTKGWDHISIPFRAEFVTTDDKGEITHFYKQYQTGNYKYAQNYDTGHEYWLREYTGVKSTVGKIVTANLEYPHDTQKREDDWTVTNKFLWDYYYNETTSPHHQDLHNDTYQTYYNKDRMYPGYPRVIGGTSYIIGFPSDRYYEFDLSGRFAPTTTSNPYQPAQLKAQTITFVSKTGASIAVSDKEKGVTADGYAFRPNYLNNPKVEDSRQNAFLLNADGNSYVETTARTVAADAFRPYFLSPEPAGSSARAIVFANEQTMELKAVEKDHGDPTAEELNGGLRIWSTKDKIYVESSLKFTADMRVVTEAGITVATFAVKPGKTVEVQADFSGMYIVHTLDGKYTKKVTVKK